MFSVKMWLTVSLEDEASRLQKDDGLHDEDEV